MSRPTPHYRSILASSKPQSPRTKKSVRWNLDPQLQAHQAPVRVQITPKTRPQPKPKPKPTDRHASHFPSRPYTGSREYICKGYQRAALENLRERLLSGDLSMTLVVSSQTASPGPRERPTKPRLPGPSTHAPGVGSQSHVEGENVDLEANRQATTPSGPSPVSYPTLPAMPAVSSTATSASASVMVPTRANGPQSDAYGNQGLNDSAIDLLSLQGEGGSAGKKQGARVPFIVLAEGDE